MCSVVLCCVVCRTELRACPGHRGSSTVSCIRSLSLFKGNVPELPRWKSGVSAVISAWELRVIDLKLITELRACPGHHGPSTVSRIRSLCPFKDNDPELPRWKSGFSAVIDFSTGAQGHRPETDLKAVPSSGRVQDITCHRPSAAYGR